MVGGMTNIKKHFAEVFAKLWKDPKYVALHERKDKRGAEWRHAQYIGKPEQIARAEAAFTRACKRIYKYEAANGLG